MRRRCWLEWAIVSFGLPAVTPLLAKLVSATGPASRSGTVPQRFLLSFAAGIVAEWLFVLGVYVLVKPEG